MATSIFDSSSEPTISILEYLQRLRRYGNFHDSCFILGLIYLDQYVSKLSIVLSKLSIHRLIITCVMLAIKFYDDNFYKNSFYAKLGGITLQEMNRMEIEMLKNINFNLNISKDVFQQYFHKIQSYQNCMNKSSYLYTNNIPIQLWWYHNYQNELENDMEYIYHFQQQCNQYYYHQFPYYIYHHDSSSESFLEYSHLYHSIHSNQQDHLSLGHINENQDIHREISYNLPSNSPFGFKMVTGLYQTIQQQYPYFNHDRLM